MTPTELARRLCIADHPLPDNRRPCARHGNEARGVWFLTQPSGSAALSVVVTAAQPEKEFTWTQPTD